MTSLAQVLQYKLLPWARQPDVTERFIVARSQMSAAQMPSGVQLLRPRIASSRVVVKNLRIYHNTRGVAARWPAAGLNEVNKLKMACVFGGGTD
jgi:hypothetical protein